MDYTNYMNKKRAGLLLNPITGSKMDMKDRIVRNTFAKFHECRLSSLSPFVEKTEGTTPFSEEGSEIFDIGYANGTWVIVGSDSSGGSSIKYSLDGVTWQDSDCPIFQSQEEVPGVCNGVIFANRQWVAVGQDDGSGIMVCYSSNGITWTASSATSIVDTSNHLNHVAYGGGRWVAVGYINDSDQNIFYSEDNARTWTPCSGGFGFGVGGTGFGATFSRGTWVAVGEKAADGVSNILHSSNGREWTAVEDAPFTTGYAAFVESSDALFVAVGMDVSDSENPKSIFTSTNGLTWSPTNGEQFLGTYCYGVRYSNGLWVATGQASDGDNILYSVDGVNWRAAAGTPFNMGGHCYAMIHGDSKWIAVGEDENGATKILTSVALC